MYLLAVACYSTQRRIASLLSTKLDYSAADICDANPIQDEPATNPFVYSCNLSTLSTCITGLSTRLLGSETAILMPVNVNKHAYTWYIATNPFEFLITFGELEGFITGTGLTMLSLLVI